MTTSVLLHWYESAKLCYEAQKWFFVCQPFLTLVWEHQMAPIIYTKAGKKNRKKSHMNKFIFKREIYIEAAILKKGIKDNNPANRERGSQSYRLDFGLNRCWLTNIQKKNRCCMPGLRVHQLIAQPVLLAKPLAALSDTSLPRYSSTLSFVESLELWSLCSQSNWSFCLGLKCVTGQIWMLLLRLCKLSSCSFLPLKLD